MSRSKDLAFIENQIATLQKSVATIQQTYQTYHAQVSESIREVLEEAGVFEDIKTLESDRDATRAAAQEKVNGIAAQINQLTATQRFLLGRDQAEPDVEPEDQPVQAEDELIEAEAADEEDDEDEAPPAVEVAAGQPRPGKIISEMGMIQQKVDEARAKKAAEEAAQKVSGTKRGKKTPTPPAF